MLTIKKKFSYIYDFQNSQMFTASPALIDHNQKNGRCIFYQNALQSWTSFKGQA